MSRARWPSVLLHQTGWFSHFRAVWFAVVLLALGAIFVPVCHAQTPLPQALLLIRYDARVPRAHFTLTVYNDDSTETQLQQWRPIFARAISQGFEDAPLWGGQPTFVDSENSSVWQVDFETELQSPRGFTRHGFLTESVFDSNPLRKALREHHIHLLRLSVFEEVRGVSIARCTANGDDGEDTTVTVSQNDSTRKFDFQNDGLDQEFAPTVHFLVGYSEPECLWRFLPPLLFLTLPLLLLERYVAKIRSLAQRLEGAEGDARAAEHRSQLWFAFFRNLTNGAMAFSYGWLCLSFACRPASPLLYLLNPSTNELRVGLGVLLYLIPPITALVAADLLSRPVQLALHGRRLSAQEVAVETSGRLLTVYLPFAFFMMISAAFMDLLDRLPHSPLIQAGYLWSDTRTYRIAGWIFGYSALATLLSALLHLFGINKVVKVTEGPLYARVMELARQAGVKITAVHFQSTGNYRMANAFALSGGTVLFTDCLVNQLSVDEVDAVIAHELAHVKRGHVKSRMQPIGFVAGLFIGLILIGVTFPRFFDDVGNFRAYVLIMLLGFPCLILAAYSVFLAISRKQEKEADLDAIKLTGRPADLILGLTRLEVLSGLPRRWKPWQERMLTHPSMERRIRYLAEAGTITPEMVDELRRSARDRDVLVDSRETVAHYPLPPNVIDPERTISPLLYDRQSLIAFWATIVVLVVVEKLALLPIALSASVASTVPLLAVSILSGVIAYSFYWWWSKHFSGAAVTRWEPEIRRVLTARFAALRHAPSARMVYIGIAPGDSPRIFGRTLDWDRGYALFDGDYLHIFGEQIEVRIARDRIVQIDDAVLWPQWFGTPRILVRWRAATDDPLELTCITVCPAASGKGSNDRRDSNALRSRLRAWWQSDAQEADSENTTATERYQPPRVPDAKGVGPERYGSRTFFWQGVWAMGSVPLAFVILTNQCIALVVGTSIEIAAFILVSMAPFLRFRKTRKAMDLAKPTKETNGVG